MFTTLIIKPIFNLLALIYGLIPGHNLGLTIIIFTVIVRLLMWPLVKKQLHHAKAMREMQPELKKIKEKTKGNRQLESIMVMQLYKEKQINPFASIGILLVQLPILIGLYSSVNKIVNDPKALVDFSYPVVQGLSWLKQLAGDITLFDGTLFGVVDLTRAAIDKAGAIYWPAMVIVIASAVTQYLQSKQLMPQAGKARKLRHILRDAQSGKSADQTEVNAAVGRSTRFFIPALIFLFTVNIASAISLYFLASGVVAMIQQHKILKQDETELVTAADKTVKKEVIEGEVVQPRRSSKKAKKSPTKKKRRK